MVCFSTICLCSCTTGRLEMHENYSSSTPEYLAQKKQIDAASSIPKINPPIKIGIIMLPQKESRPISQIIRASRCRPDDISEADREKMRQESSSYDSLSSITFSENAKYAANELIRQECAVHDGVRSAQIVPKIYFNPDEGFAKLVLVGEALEFDVALFISYTQELTYQEDQGFEALTAVTAKAYHIKSQQLLFEASGNSQFLSNSGEVFYISVKKKNMRDPGLIMAVENLLPDLKNALETFIIQTKTNSDVSKTSL